MLSDIPLPLIETHCLYEVMRRLGFEPEQLYFTIADDSIGLTVRDEEHECFMMVAQRPMFDDDTLAEAWEMSCAVWNEADDADLNAHLGGWLSNANIPKLIFILTQHGFKPKFTLIANDSAEA